MPVLIGGFLQYVLGISMFLVAFLLVLLILVQRGRGGGLTGALGGVGGQSAFGTKAGDLFTRITIVAASVWLFLCLLTIAVLNGKSTFKERPRAGKPSAGAVTGKSDSEADTNGSGTPKADQPDTTGQPDADGQPKTTSPPDAAGQPDAAGPGTGSGGAK